MVECLAVLRQVTTLHPFQGEYIVAQLVNQAKAPLSVLQMALVRDCLMGAGKERLHKACARPRWEVDSADLYCGHFFSHNDAGISVPTRRMQTSASDGQLVLTGLVITCSAVNSASCITLNSHPWQTDPQTAT